MSGFDLKNEEEVKEYLENLGIEYRFGCYHEKRADACQLLGDYLSAIKHDYRKAFKVYQKNCDERDDRLSCHNTGGYFASGKGGEKDWEKAYQYYVKGCALNHYASCFNAGSIDHHRALAPMKEDENNPRDCQLLKRALGFFKKACDLGKSPDACFQYSSEIRQGVKDCIQADAREALKYSVMGCEEKSIQCCHNASIAYKNGDGAPANQVLSEFYRKAFVDLNEQENEKQRQMKFGETGP